MNVLICVILNMIASAWNFSQNPQIMTYLTQIGKYFYLISLK